MSFPAEKMTNFNSFKLFSSSHFHYIASSNPKIIMASCFKNKIRSGCHLKPLYLKTLQMNPPEQQDSLPAQILCNWFITLIAVVVRSISSQYEVILIIAAARL